ncbi:hypothetical protein DaDZ19_13760 [Dickeya ananatis]
MEKLIQHLLAKVTGLDHTLDKINKSHKKKRDFDLKKHNQKCLKIRLAEGQNGISFFHKRFFDFK